MKKKVISFSLFLLCALSVHAQLLSWTPNFAKDNDNISIIVDGNKGNLALASFSGTVYVHTGVITSASNGPTDWKYSKFTWGSTSTAAQATALGNGKWKYDITNIRAFYGVPANEIILKIAILFRDGAGNIVQRNADGSDMYIPLYNNNLAIRFEQPLMQPLYNQIPELINKTIGEQLPINAITNNAANISLWLNGTVINITNNATSNNASPTLTQIGANKIVAEATQGAIMVKDSIAFFVAPATNVAALPANMIEGINYHANNTEVTLVLFAPNKNRVCVIGEFTGSNWVETTSYLMNKTPDGKYWWKTITGLTPGTEYAFQYLVDGYLKIGDPYCQKVLDPWNDQYIFSSTYPNLKPYPQGQQGIVSVLQTNEPAYTWQTTNFARPNKKNLIVYELLVRDFVSEHDFKTVMDSLQYLKNLGINAIEIMPFNEFEGNESWGYNPNYYFAPDKYYGPKNAVKQFIDAAHQKGIAVIMDMTMNHVFGSAPQARLYWDAANNKPATNNPWLNPDAKHPYNVGYDFNHQSNETKYLVDRVVTHWLTEYKLDGFRWDLSKGFTQTFSNNVNFWNLFDLDRINTWKRIYDKMQTVSANSYCILEHLGANDEEQELSNYGMLLWGKETDAFNEMSKGYVNNSNIQGVIHTARNWNNPHLVGYAESHDEERTMYKNINEGNNSNSNHNVRNTSVALRRNELIAAHLLMTPGPKMIWQFAELGYDYSINYCTNGTISNNCRLDKKPIRWDFYQDPQRRRLYDVYASLNKLRALKPNCFANGITTWNTSGLVKWMVVNDASLKVVVISNMSVNQSIGAVTFPTSGTYYDYLNGGTFAATGTVQNFTLAPGEYKVYIDQDIDGRITTGVFSRPLNITNLNVSVYPNPINDNAIIQYDMPENAKINISLVNNFGQQIAVLFDGFRLKGTYQLSYKKPVKVASGWYFLKFTINGKQSIQKIILN